MNDPFLEFPFAVDGRGRTATTDDDHHLSQMLYQLLFTDPGERVNRPEFGCGVRHLVFLPNSGALASATQALVKGNLETYLGDIIKVERIDVSHGPGALVPEPDAVLKVTIVYSRRVTGERHVAQFTAPQPGALV